MNGSVVSGLQKRVRPYNIAPIRIRKHTQNGRLARVLPFLRRVGLLVCWFEHDGRARGARHHGIRCHFAGRAAAAFLFGWHSVFLLVGLLQKIRAQRLARDAAALFYFSLCAFFLFLSFRLLHSLFFFLACVLSFFLPSLSVVISTGV